MDELAAGGAQTADSPRQVAERSDVGITMRPDSADVESSSPTQAATPPDSVLAGCRPGTLR